MGFYATDTLDAAPPRGATPRRARRVPARGRNPHRGPTRGVLSGYRFYQPETGRWLGRDPLGVKPWRYVEDAPTSREYVLLMGMLRPHVFCKNGPVSLLDLLGLNTNDPIADFTIYPGMTNNPYGLAADGVEALLNSAADSVSAAKAMLAAKSVGEGISEIVKGKIKDKSKEPPGESWLHKLLEKLLTPPCS